MKLLRKNVIFLIVLSMALLFITGCAEKTGHSIQLTKETCSLQEGEATTIAALTEQEVVVLWQSSDEKVASVVDGKIYAKREGETIITANAGGEKAECKVTVYRNPMEDYYLMSKEEGYYLELSDKKGIATSFVICSKGEDGSVTEQEATDLTYEMYNKGIATVDEEGVIKPLETGPTTMTVSSGELSCTVDVVVSTKLIHNPKDWLEVIGSTDNLDAYYYVTKDLDFRNTDYSNVSTEATSDATKCFRGTIDGGNHTIKNITASGNGGGIFPSLCDAKIWNLSFEDVGSAKGGIAPGIFGHSTVFENVFVDFRADGEYALSKTVDGSPRFTKCLMNVSGNRELAGSITATAQFANLIVLFNESVPSNIPEGVWAFADKMDAIWTINSQKLLGTNWNYVADDIPQLSK